MYDASSRVVEADAEDVGAALDLDHLAEWEAREGVHPDLQGLETWALPGAHSESTFGNPEARHA